MRQFNPISRTIRAKSLTFGLQGLHLVEPALPRWTAAGLDEVATLCHFRSPIAVDHAGRLGEVRRLARHKQWQRTRRVAELLFDRLPQVLEQVEAIGDLPCLRCTLRGALGVEIAEVAAHHLDRRMLAELSGGGFG